MKKFKKKSLTIEAIKFDGENVRDVLLFASAMSYHVPSTNCIYIRTLEGDMRAGVGDWIIKGVKGEFYPCKPDIFAASYDEVVE